MTEVSRDIRRCALQTLFQMDILSNDDSESIAVGLEDGPFSDRVQKRGRELATGAWSARDQLDLLVKPFSPDWPTHRQPIIDRNILRLALHEINHVGTPGKKAINDAVELAKEFGTEKSPAFVNAVLDRIWKSDPTVETSAPDGAPG
ncbi:MAG: transcription antitermination factor NusB [Planctomycetota bacterium]|nr:transcription antitermination factor NusB [Planctomycetota bacterium]